MKTSIVVALAAMGTAAAFMPPVAPPAAARQTTLRASDGQEGAMKSALLEKLRARLADPTYAALTVGFGSDYQVETEEAPPAAEQAPAADEHEEAAAEQEPAAAEHKKPKAEKPKKAEKKAEKPKEAKKAEAKEVKVAKTEEAPAPAAVAVAEPAVVEKHLGTGGMADTRNPDPVDHDDPRKSISKAPTFEEYLKSRQGK